MHVLPRVRELEKRFADSMTVIGVHAGKFPAERFTDRIAEACDRLGVLHPVVNDRQFRVWRDYAVNAWPTVVAIDPEGYLAFVEQGEFSLETVSAELARIAQRAEERGTLVRGPDSHPSTLRRHQGALRFPTRVILGAGRLWVADTGHGRVLECSWEPREAAARVVVEHDGFIEPRGLAVVGGRVHVADRAGHALWRLDGADRVRVAGTGELGRSAIAPGPAPSVDLRSPWGIAAVGGRLAVTMAGTHQLWWFDPDRGELTLLAGTGAEALGDGPLTTSLLAQPTGVALMQGDELAFADCESSAVRTVSPDGVRTIVGTGLFDFGDRPGVGDAVLLEHCEDVAFHTGELAVADTYNDRIKRVIPATRECAPWAGEAGEKGQLREPAGIWSDGESLLVADTGHHRVVVVKADGALVEVSFE